MTTTPNYDLAAITAAEALITYQITSAPIDPLKILKSMPNVLLLSFAEMATTISVERSHAVTIFGDQNQDAVTTAFISDGSLRYVITYK